MDSVRTFDTFPMMSLKTNTDKISLAFSPLGNTKHLLSGRHYWPPNLRCGFASCRHVWRSHQPSPHLLSACLKESSTITSSHPVCMSEGTITSSPPVCMSEGVINHHFISCQHVCRDPQPSPHLLLLACLKKSSTITSSPPASMSVAIINHHLISSCHVCSNHQPSPHLLLLACL